MGFSKQECCSECHALLQGLFPNQGSNLCLFHLLLWQAGSLPLVPGKPTMGQTLCIILNKEMILVSFTNKEAMIQGAKNLFHVYIVGMAEQWLDFRWLYTKSASFKYVMPPMDIFMSYSIFCLFLCFFVIVSLLHIEGKVSRVPFAKAREGQKLKASWGSHRKTLK